MPEIASIIHLVLAGLATFFAIIVLGVTNDQLKAPFDSCYLGNRLHDNRGCDTAIAMGTLGLIAGSILTVLAIVELVGIDALALLNSKPFSLAKAVVSGVMAFLFLVTFGVVVDEYTDGSGAERDVHKTKSDAQAVSAFSFFSIMAWVALLVIYIMRVVRGNPASAAAPSAPVA